MHRKIKARIHQEAHAMEKAPLNVFERQFVADSGSVCLSKFSHYTCPSSHDIEPHRGEGPDIGSSTGSESGHLDFTESFISHDGVSETTEQTGIKPANDNDDVHGGLFREPQLGCDKHSRDLYNFQPHEVSFDCLANIASNDLFNVQSFTDGEVVDAASVFTKAGADMDLLAIKLGRSVGPGRQYHHLQTNGHETQGPGAAGTSGSRPNEYPISNMVFTTWMCPQERTFDTKRAIQQIERSGLPIDPTAGSHPWGVNTSLHGTRFAPACGPFNATVGELMAVIGIFLAEIHRAEFAAINVLIGALDEKELATLGMLLAAMDEEELAADFSTIEDKSPPKEAYWKDSPSTSNATRQTRLDEFPKGVVQRLMPHGGTIYFGMDMDSFTSANIEPDVTDCLRDAAIGAAEDIRERNLGIAFAYTTDPRHKVFNICFDPGLPFVTLAQGFFPGDQPDRWRLGVSSLASVRWVFDRNRAHIPKIFSHEFAHILGLRHYNAGSDAVELREQSFLWPGTRDGDCNTIMRTGVSSGNLEFSDEDIWVIRDFYSKRNGALVDGVRIMDVDPYKRLWDFFLHQARRLNGPNRPRKR